jgi:hypothetical protein
MTEIIISLVSGVIGALGGSFSVILFYKSTKRTNNAIALHHEIENDKDYIEIYKDLIKEYQKLLCFNQACKERINA